MKSELSKRNQYYIHRHRYLELRHFCLQYKDWERALSHPIEAPGRPLNGSVRVQNHVSDETSRVAVKRAEIGLYLQLVRDTCYEADAVIGKWILIGVTQGVSFDNLKLIHGIPCERDMYYDRYRKFFWLLDKKR